MGVCNGTFFHDALDLSGFGFFGQIVKTHGLLHGPKQTIGVEMFKQKAVSGMGLQWL